MYGEFSIKEWLTTTHHKRVGVLYIVTAIFFLILAGSLGMLMRTQLATPNETFLTPGVYEQIVTLHGLLMILWVLSALGFGIANFIVPLQIGAKDLAFPRLNATSFWMYFFSGVLLVGTVFLPGGSANTGWTLYAPLNTLQFSPQSGETLAVLAMALFAVAGTMSAINFITTIVKNRAKGVTWTRLPVFTWSILMTMALAFFAFPPLAVGLLLLTTDRVLGTVFFSSAQGGSILWEELFWFFGHPEVYIVVFPAIGIIAEVFITFAKRPLFAKKIFIIEFAAVTFLSLGVWMHHMFTTGVNYDALQVFSVTTLAISVPFEGLVLGLVLTLRKGNIKLSAPMLYCLAAIFTVTLGGVTGVLQAFPVLDYAFNGTYWIVGHFHYVMAGTTLFALIAGLYYWWPKMTGRKYNEKFAVITFAISFIGFNVLYFPYFFLLDMPRRISTYAASTGWASLNFDATVGAFVFGPAILLTLLNLILSYRKNERCELNPWGAKEMEWTGDYCGSASDPKSMNVSNVTGTNADSLDIPGNSKILERRDIS
ncbi:MAG: cbb3-type cytochrome c oxidase subunit I [Candidatus Bathyarchaeia archaeon]